MKLIREDKALNSNSNIVDSTTPTETTANRRFQFPKPIEDSPAEKCVQLKILAEPPPGTPIRADIIFIHGLHGSLVNTWKQGRWNKSGKQVEIERPPEPPIRPPKRQKHSRTTHIKPPHLSKRRKFGEYKLNDYLMNENGMIETDDYRYFCYNGEQQEPETVEFVDDVEFSFPTFRLRTEEDDDENDDEEEEEDVDDGEEENENVPDFTSKTNPTENYDNKGKY